MKRKCDKCDKPATNHSVEIQKGQKVVTYLCDEHAAEAGIMVKDPHVPVQELLSNFVKIHSGAPTTQEQACKTCGQTFGQFREHSLLGCPDCYTAFEAQLGPLLERAHEGATHHIGKVPSRAGQGEQRQAALLRMRKNLADAVASEDYERAATLRDELRSLEEKGG
ncbi:MAG: UvrB/UvrC motif-containing protein [Planctomycetes bacterium]|nr:UvrB/UvrC motif-containing protein [Planctomycetota bacterium]